MVQVEIAAATTSAGRRRSADGTADGAVVVLVGHRFAAELEQSLGVLAYEGGRGVGRGTAVGVGRFVETTSGGDVQRWTVVDGVALMEVRLVG